MTYPSAKPRGYTPLLEGATYSRWPMSHQLAAYSLCRLKVHNETTGTCKLESIPSGYVIFMSADDLSHWHLIDRPGA